MSAATRAWRGEDGGATVLACLAVIALLALTLLTAQVGAIVAGRHRAQAVADLGALAAAGALDAGSGAGCARAEEIARHMRARVLECTVVGWDVTLSVETSVVAGPFGARSVRAAARAGPVEPDSS
ncbi:Rv3654c family TadE-like protein [Nocardia sp. NPDC051570]|uniref:Rv3654c family TadE-like protein n=1 Tax=Nocardia sp. NPDC051570 TaxID=3364324 RepID=UPI00378DB28B